MRRRRKKPEGVAPLTDYYNVKQNCLTIMGSRVLKLYSEGVPQIEIAKRLGTSRAGIHYWVRKLSKLGLIHLTKRTRGAQLPPFDVRWRALYWKLPNPVKLPYDEEHFTNSVKHQSWSIKNCLIRQHIGPNGSSLEIEAGYSGGRSIDEAILKHDEKAMRLFDWLKQHYPALNEASPVEIHKGGEICLNSLRGLAKQALDDSGASIIKGSGFKIDQSRGYPELQVYFDKFATREELNQLAEAVMEMSKTMNEVRETLSELVKYSTKPPERPGSSDYR